MFAAVSIVDVRKMTVAAKYPHKYQVNELAFSPDDRTFLQATNLNEVEVHAYPEMRKVGALKGHTSSVLSLAYDPQGKYIATGGADALACLWDATDFICLRTLYAIDNPIRALSFSHDSKYLALTGSEDPAVYVEEVEGGKSLGAVPLRSSPEDCCWHPKHNVLVYPVEQVTGEGVQTAIEWRKAPRGG
jgi:THO complex subunit 3